MPVSRTHRWTLDQAALSSSQLAAAGGGLPRRIMQSVGPVHFNIMADAPVIYCPGIDAANRLRNFGSSGGSFGGTGGPLPNWTPALSPFDSIYYSPSSQAAILAYGPTTDLSAPFTAECYVGAHSTAANIDLWSTRGNGSGWRFGKVGGTSKWRLDGVSSSPAGQVLTLDFDLNGFQGGVYPTDRFVVTVAYDGIDLSPTRFHVYANGWEATRIVVSNTTTAGALFAAELGGVNWGIWQMVYWAYIDWGICAVYNYSVPPARLETHASLPATGRARWSRSFASPATVRGLLVPGGTARSQGSGADYRSTRTYLSLDGGVTRTEVVPGADPAYAVAAGQTLTVDAELTSYSQAGNSPWIADDSGAGPGVVWDEDLSQVPSPTGSTANVPVPPRPVGWTSPPPPPVGWVVKS